MAKNRRKYQKNRRDAIRKDAEKEEVVTSLFTSVGHFRRDARTAADLIANGAVSEERAEGLLKKLVEMGEKTQKSRELVSIVNALNKVAKTGLDDKKVQLVERRFLEPVAPVSAPVDMTPEVEDDEPPPIAFLEHGASEEELAETFKVLVDCGIVERTIEKYERPNED